MGTSREKINSLMESRHPKKDSKGAAGFIKDKSRDKKIVRTSILGILANVLLAGTKAIVGIFSNSIAIILDAVNNLSDAASSIITIVGVKLASKEADKKHPFGHGRVEYLSAMIIALVVIYAGTTSLVEAIKKIINPLKPDYSPVLLILLAAGVAVKIVMGLYVKRVGKAVKSNALINSGEDALLDSIISTSTLAAALIYIYKGISLEAWLGAFISAVIIKAGFGMLRETISQIMGERADPELAKGIKETVAAYPGVSGVYDLVLNNYGPEYYNGSIHIEVPDTYSADRIDQMVRDITIEVLEKYNVILTAIGVYSMNTQDEEAIAAREAVGKIVMKREHVLQMHGFYIDNIKKRIRFDIVVSFDAQDRMEVYRKACEDVQKEYPEYSIEAAMDVDFSESE